jgi:hypothetical protein
MAQNRVAAKQDKMEQVTTRGSASRINRLLTVVEISILIGVIVLFNAFPEKVGMYSSAVEPYVFVPLLTPDWLPYIPWLNVWWGLALTLALVKLVYGRWTEALRWADLGVHLLSICVLASVILGYTFAGGHSSGVQQNAGLMLVGFKALLGLVLVAQFAGFFSRLRRLGVSVPVLQWRFD